MSQACTTLGRYAQQSVGFEVRVTDDAAGGAVGGWLLLHTVRACVGL